MTVQVKTQPLLERIKGQLKALKEEPSSPTANSETARVEDKQAGFSERDDYQLQRAPQSEDNKTSAPLKNELPREGVKLRPLPPKALGKERFIPRRPEYRALKDDQLAVALDSLRSNEVKLNIDFESLLDHASVRGGAITQALPAMAARAAELGHSISLTPEGLDRLVGLLPKNKKVASDVHRLVDRVADEALNARLSDIEWGDGSLLDASGGPGEAAPLGRIPFKGMPRANGGTDRRGLAGLEDEGIVSLFGRVLGHSAVERPKISLDQMASEDPQKLRRALPALRRALELGDDQVVVRNLGAVAAALPKSEVYAQELLQIAQAQGGVDLFKVPWGESSLAEVRGHLPPAWWPDGPMYKTLREPSLPNGDNTLDYGELNPGQLDLLLEADEGRAIGRLSDAEYALINGYLQKGADGFAGVDRVAELMSESERPIHYLRMLSRMAEQGLAKVPLGELDISFTDRISSDDTETISTLRRFAKAYDIPESEVMIGGDRTLEDSYQSSRPDLTPYVVDKALYQKTNEELEALSGAGGGKRAIEQRDAAFIYQQEEQGGVKLGRDHFHFTGTPGVGKSTLAELMGKRMVALGYGGELFDLKAIDLVGNSEDDSRTRVAKYLHGFNTAEGREPGYYERAREGFKRRHGRDPVGNEARPILLLDEFGEVLSKAKEGTPEKAALDALMNEVEQGDKFVVLSTGYQEQYTNPSNRGFASRFKLNEARHDIEPYGGDVLADPLAGYLDRHGLQMGEEVRSAFLSHLDGRKDWDKDYASIRTMFSMLEAAEGRMASRVVQQRQSGNLVRGGELRMEDVFEAAPDMSPGSKFREEFDRLANLPGLRLAGEEAQLFVSPILKYLIAEQGPNPTKRVPKTSLLLETGPGVDVEPLVAQIAKLYKEAGLTVGSEPVPLQLEQLITGFAGQNAKHTKESMETVHKRLGLISLDQADAAGGGQNGARGFGSEIIDGVDSYIRSNLRERPVIITGTRDQIRRHISQGHSINELVGAIKTGDYSEAELSALVDSKLAEANLGLDPKAKEMILAELKADQDAGTFRNMVSVEQLVDGLNRQVARRNLTSGGDNRIANREDLNSALEVLAREDGLHWSHYITGIMGSRTARAKRRMVQPIDTELYKQGAEALETEHRILMDAASKLAKRPNYTDSRLNKSLPVTLAGLRLKVEDIEIIKGWLRTVGVPEDKMGTVGGLELRESIVVALGKLKNQYSEMQNMDLYDSERRLARVLANENIMVQEKNEKKKARRESLTPLSFFQGGGGQG